MLPLRALLRQVTHRLAKHPFYRCSTTTTTTRHKRYETSTTLAELVNEVDELGPGYCSLSKIICTVGPSTHSPSLIQNLVDEGMQIMRINCAKSTIEETKERVSWLRECHGLQGGSGSSSKFQDTPHPPNRPRNLRSVMFDTKSEEHLKLALELDVDFVSFNASDVDTVQSTLSDLQQSSHTALPKLIAKIQSADALTNFDDILQVADGILIERGLLAVDIPLGVVRAQKQIVQKCNVAGKPVIIASQMLDSMLDHPTPTRAEVSDIVNAVYDGADCVMLSRESSEGSFPIESCQTLAKIAWKADKAQAQHSVPVRRQRSTPPPTTTTTTAGEQGSRSENKEQDYFNRGVWPAMTRAAVQQAQSGDVDLIVVITSSGKTAEMCSAEKGPVPIMAFVADPKVGRQLSMFRGVQPVYGPIKHMPPVSKKFETNVSLRISKEKKDMVQHEFLMVRPKEAVIRAKELNMVQTGDTVLIVMSEPSSNVLGRTLTTRTARVK